MSDYVPNTIKYKNIISVLKENTDLDLINQKEAVIDHLIVIFELNNSEKLRCAIKNQLRQKFYNNYNNKFNNLPKNKKTIEDFQNKYENWLEFDLVFSFDETDNQIDTPGNYAVILN